MVKTLPVFNKYKKSTMSIYHFCIAFKFICYKSFQIVLYSLFDGASQRYQKLKMNIDKVIIMQIGLSTFQFVRDENKYIVHTYRIPVFPSSFGTVDVVYLSQASSIRFLSNYKFDFNKVSSQTCFLLIVL